MSKRIEEHLASHDATPIESAIQLHPSAVQFSGGFLAIPRIIEQDETLGVGEMYLWARLLHYATLSEQDFSNPDSAAYAGEDRLARECRVSISSIRRWKKVLVQRGWLVAKKRGQGLTDLHYIAVPERYTNQTTQNDISRPLNLTGNITEYTQPENTHTRESPKGENSPAFTPAQFVEALLTAQNKDPSAAAKDRTWYMKQLGVAKRIRDRSYTPFEVNSCTRWLMAQDWLKDQFFDLGLVDTQIGKWHAAGRPRPQANTKGTDVISAGGQGRFVG